MSVASVLATGRRSDTVFRVGGDEFAVLLPATDLPEVLTALERVRAEVESRTLGVTLSVGVAVLDPATPDVVSLWEAADTAVYAVKRSGGNHVVGYDAVRVGYDAVRESGIATVAQS